MNDPSSLLARKIDTLSDERWDGDASVAGKRFGIVPHLRRPQARELAGRLIAELERRGATVEVPSSDAKSTGLEAWAVPDHRFGENCTLAFSLGGDGSMLRTVDLVSAHGVPVLGVNVGHLGYLTVLQPEELPAAFARILSGEYHVEERMTLHVSVLDEDPSSADGPTSRHYVALNDAVLEKSSAGNTVRLGVYFNDEHFMDYSADGVIVATPTGSTAYAFSARGPIVSPGMNALIIVPVSAHMLFDRSLVLDGSETVRAIVMEGRPASLFVDGRHAGTLIEGSSMLVRRGDQPARLVTFTQRRFHERLKAKFGLLPGRSATGDAAVVANQVPQVPQVPQVSDVRNPGHGDAR